MRIYIHIPFCVRKCKYCAFFSVPNRAELYQPYVDALCVELERRATNEPVETIYIGGGTPTVLSIAQLDRIVATINRLYSLAPNVELTVEANPGTIDRHYLKQLRSLGVNRISIGVQSFDDRLLRSIGRIHTVRDAIEIVSDAKSIFDNVSVDMIYSLPHQTLDDVKRAIDQIKRLDVEHVSSYGLELEEGSEFYRLHAEGRLPLPTEELDEAMYDYVTTELPRLGYRRYEISNFAKPGFESRHNLGYWSDAKYLGLGAGAHSYDHVERRSNVEDVVAYIEGINNGRDVSTLEETITREIAVEEFCFLALRKADGIDRRHFQKKFDTAIEKIFGSVIDELALDGLIAVDDDRIRLTERGMKLGNIVFAEFLL
ncbi:MAG: radical SAM family heme chaperone HemW [Selenomonadaceae bacterium]|nr:radical SAM family heme chaperone HemW [Selenomonadaceae bacterium]